MRPGNAASPVPVETVVEMGGAPQHVMAMARVAEHACGLPRKRAHRSASGQRTAARDLVRDTADGAPRNGGNSAQQASGGRRSV